MIFAILFQLLIASNSTAQAEEFHNWQFCTSNSGQEVCSPIKLNENIQYRLAGGNFQGVYKAEFTPDKCKTNGCWLFIGEGADNINVAINSATVYTQNDRDGAPFYTRYLSNAVFLPSALIKDENKIEIRVKDLNQTIFGIRTGSVTLGSFSEVSELQFFDFFKRTGITLLSFYSLVVIFITLFLMSLMTRSLGVATLALYSGATAVYLFSFSEIPRSYFDPIFTTGPLHFSLRLFQDFTLSILIGFYFQGTKFAFRKSILVIYTAAIASQFGLWVFGDHTYKAFLYLMYGLSPLIFFPMGYGFLQSLRYKEDARIKIWLVLFFILMMALQMNDLFAFWQVYKGFFFVRFYPNFILILFTLMYIDRELKHRLMIQKEILIGQLATKLSHDIRSPLAALQMTAGNTSHLPEDQKTIIRNAIDRIREIANSLLKEHRSVSSSDSIAFVPNKATLQLVATELTELASEIVNEKRAEYSKHSNLKLEFKADTLQSTVTALIEPNELKRILSNLINNAVESLNQFSGLVQVTIKKSKNNIEIIISDQGCGIPADVLPKLFQKGASFGKKDGNGLGLASAKEMIEAMHGSIDIESKEGNGTNVTLRLPLAQAVDIFTVQINLKNVQTVTIVDDDRSVHDFWKERLKDHQNIKLQHFYSPQEFMAYMRTNFGSEDQTLFLVDYEFKNSDMNGLELIESFGIETQSLLVTGKSENIEIQTKCEKLGLKILEKNKLSEVVVG